MSDSRIGKRLTAKVSANVAPRVKHYIGFPPAITDGEDTRQQLPGATLLVILEKGSGVFLVRFTSDGEFAGDTWHETIDDAKHQAEFEFGDGISAWHMIPPEVDDVVAYGLQAKLES
jgi:hypothetical protein